VQLFNLADDPGEQTNLSAKEPQRVQELVAQLAAAIRNGRTNSGPKQSNEGWPATFHNRVLSAFPELRN